MRQLSIFDIPAAPKTKQAHVTPAQTSRQAAESIEGSSKALRAQIYRYIQSQKNGATCWECEVALGMRHQTASARIRELVQQSLIESSGKVRPTESGRNAVVYCAVAERLAA